MDKSWISWAPWVADLDSVCFRGCSGTFVSKSLNIFKDFRICRDSKSEIGIPWRSVGTELQHVASVRDLFVICSWSLRTIQVHQWWLPCTLQLFSEMLSISTYFNIFNVLRFVHITRYLLLSARCAVCSTIIWVKFRSLTPKALMMVCCGAAQGRLNRDSWSNNW